MSAPSITGATAGDYSITSDSCAPYPSTLNGGETCTLEVTFQPAAIGSAARRSTSPAMIRTSPTWKSAHGRGRVPGQPRRLLPVGATGVRRQGQARRLGALLQRVLQRHREPRHRPHPMRRRSAAAGRRPDRQLDAHRPRGGAEGRRDLRHRHRQRPPRRQRQRLVLQRQLSWGFAKQGDPINRIVRRPRDPASGAAPLLAHGWRVPGWGLASGGVTTQLQRGLHPLHLPSGPRPGAWGEPAKRKIEVGEKAKFEAKVRNVGFLPASDVEVCIAGAGGALEPTNQCKAVGDLAPDGRATKSSSSRRSPRPRARSSSSISPPTAPGWRPWPARRR